MELTTGTAVWHHSGLPVLPIRWVLLRDPQGHFDPQALLCTDRTLSRWEIVRYFIRRWLGAPWAREVTFAEARRHLGVEARRQWNDRDIARTTPILFALFSLVTLLATRLVRDGTLPVRTAAWYAKATPTFSDALAAVRRHWWRHPSSGMSGRQHDIIKVPRGLFRRLADAVAYAA